MRRMVTALLLAATSAGLSGCFLWTTRGEGDSLRSEERDHERRLHVLESGMQSERQQLRAEVAEAKTKVAQLQKVLERATRVVTRNSADLGAQVEDLRRQMAELSGQIAELSHANQQQQQQITDESAALGRRIDAFARRAGIDMPLDPSQVPADKDAHWHAADQAYQAGQWSKARALLREYIRRYPHDDHADDAQYRIGASYLSEDHPATALGELRKVLSDYPHGDILDHALFDMGTAFYELHACTDARSAFEALLHDHRHSPLARQARTKLHTVQHAPRGYCTS